MQYFILKLTNLFSEFTAFPVGTPSPININAHFSFTQQWITVLSYSIAQFLLTLCINYKMKQVFKNKSCFSHMLSWVRPKRVHDFSHYSRTSYVIINVLKYIGIGKLKIIIFSFVLRMFFARGLGVFDRYSC